MTKPYDITPTTCLDFPGRVACILWYAGCNLRCPYCYNPEVVFGKQGDKDWETFLYDRKDFLDGVVLSGGECTLVPDISDICSKIKELGLDVKIDTNGSNPSVLEALIKNNLVDYVAIDNKMPSSKSWKLQDGSLLFDRFSECIRILKDNNMQYEVRTTIHPGLLSEDDIVAMIKEVKQLGYRGIYYLQNYFKDVETIGNIGNPKRKYDKVKINELAPLLVSYR